VRPQEEVERSISPMLKKDSSSSNSMKVRRRLNCARTLRCMEVASMETHALTLMAFIKFKRKLISQAIL